MNLYFMAAMNGDEPVAIKIGYALDPEKRRKSIQAGCPYPIHIMRQEAWSGRFEPKLQKVFGDDRMHGDWFRPSPELLTFVKHGHIDPLTGEMGIKATA